MKPLIAQLTASKKLLGLVFALAIVSFGCAPVSASSCPTNDILPCGATSPADFIRKVRAEVKPDLQTIYASSRYDLPKSDYDRFAKEAVAGRIDGDGNLIVDGKIIGTNSKSIGRNEKSKSWAVSIGGDTYHESYDRDLIQNYMNAMVLFNNDGSIQTVIIRECGNPVTVTPVKPKYTCDLLNHDQVDRDTYRFSTDARASGGAKVDHVEYNFGDGSTIVKRDAPTTVVTHTYNKSGTFKAKVTVYVELPSGSLHSIAPAGDCVAPITIKPLEKPSKPSIEIVKKVENANHATVHIDSEYHYQIAVTNTGNVDVHDVVLTDTPEHGILLIDADAGKVTFNVWRLTIKTLGTGETRYFTLRAKVPSYKSGTLTNTVCANTPDISGTKDACDDATVDVPKPGLGGTKPDKETPIIEVEQKEEPKVLAETTTAPKVLPSTGPFDVALGVTSIGSLAGAGYYWRTSRRAFIDKMLGR